MRVGGMSSGLMRTAAFVALLAASADPAGAAGGAVAGPGYHMEGVRGAGSIAALRTRLGAAELDQVLRLNRVDLDHARRLDSLVVPDRLAGFVAPSPFPARLPRFDSLAKAVVVALRVQAFAMYEHGELKHWGPVSSGKASSPTPPGRFHVNWKEPLRRSSVDSTWLMPWCVNIDNRVGTALHQYDLPGRPASHCCIRLLEADARRVYDWVDTWRVADGGRRLLAPGTPVDVVGDYDFDAPPPWRRLPADPEADHLRLEELEAIAVAEEA